MKKQKHIFKTPNNLHFSHKKYFFYKYYLSKKCILKLLAENEYFNINKYKNPRNKNKKIKCTPIKNEKMNYIQKMYTKSKF